MRGWSVFIILTAVLLAQVVATASTAQEVQRQGGIRGKIPEYYISLGPEGSIEEELLIKVNIWGHVSKPGQYMVPSTTDLVSLISFAGGPTENAKLRDIRIVRSNNETQEVLHVNLEKYIDTANQDLIPILMPGDTVILPGSFRYLVTRTVGFVFQFINVVYIYSLIFPQ